MTIIQNPQNIFPFHIDSAIFSGLTQPLTDFGIIRARGADAASFIHGQLTQDFSLLKPLQNARLAAFCSPKGRILASFIGVKLASDDIILIISADLLAPILKRLKMFVLRAKCELSDASADFSVRGAAGVSALGAAELHAWDLRGDAEHFTIVLPSVLGVPRGLVVVQNGGQNGTQISENLSKIQELNMNAWHWLDTASGCATVRAATSDAFVPQMLNYESLDGVNFKKGCYPGQEVVARSQFRGTIKRRTFVAKILENQDNISDFPAGCEVFVAADLSGDDAQAAGTLLQIAGAVGQDLPAVAQISMTAAQAQGELVARAPSGRTLKMTVLGLPYILQEDI